MDIIARMIHFVPGNVVCAENAVVQQIVLLFNFFVIHAWWCIIYSYLVKIRSSHGTCFGQ